MLLCCVYCYYFMLLIRMFDGSDRYDDMDAVEVAAVCLVTGRGLGCPDGVRGHPNNPLFFMPVALTNFDSSIPVSAGAPSRQVSSTSPRKGNTPLTPGSVDNAPAFVSDCAHSCGWVLVISFAGKSQYIKFTADASTATSSPDEYQSQHIRGAQQQPPSVKKSQPLTAMSTAKWICQSLGRWVQAHEMHLVGTQRQNIETYTRYCLHYI